jgi:hypothetical protein
MVPEGSPPPDLVGVAHALRLEAALTQLTGDRLAASSDVLVLKGPPVQRRLLGEPAAYRSDDLDVLIRGLAPGAAKRHLRERGWTFHAGNGTLWRLDGAAAFFWHNAQIDVHWGLHVGLVPARRMRPLATRMWQGARATADGWLEPDDLSLATYLVLHSADRLAHAGKRRLLEATIAAADHDWDAIERMAGACGMAAVPPLVRARLAAGVDDGVDVLRLTYGRRRSDLVRLFRQKLPRRLGLDGG